MHKWMRVMLVLLACHGAQALGANMLLLRDPTMSRTQIVFEYGGELWSVPRAGGVAHVLASGIDLLTTPMFSPDGKWIAFSGTFQKNTDVYVVPADGGQPRRLTYYPTPNIAVGWTPDGNSVLFRSHRYSFSDPDQLFTVPLAGGFPTELPLPAAEMGSYSPDGSHIAYVPGFQWEKYWQGYKGGQQTRVWVARLSDSSVVRIPAQNADETDPMWVGNQVYFLSDRDGPATLYVYDTANGAIKRLIDNTGFDITSASAGPGGIVYSQFGELYVYDFATGKSRAVRVTVNGDLPQRRPYYKSVANDIAASGISPHGVRALFAAHGDIFTVPAKHGSIDDLTHSPAAMDRDPAWSPDGQSIAYFSDRAGEYDLYVRHQDGTGPVRRIVLGQSDAFYHGLTWSPDSHKLLFSDQKLNLWYVNLAERHPLPVKVATDDFDSPLHAFYAKWSPDSGWIAYAKLLPNNLHAIFVFGLKDGSTHQVTDGQSDCLSPTFDAGGKYLYFTSSTDTALTQGWLDMSSLEHPVLRNVYVTTLRAGLASPLAPRAGYESASSSKSNAESKPKDSRARAAAKRSAGAPQPVSIDFNGLEARAVPLPVPPGNYLDLKVGAAGVLYLIRQPTVLMPADFGPHGPALTVLQFDLKSRKSSTLVGNVTDVSLAARGAAMLYRRGKTWFIAKTAPHAKPAPLDLKSMRVLVVPPEQWAEMYHDAWRIEKAFFYNPIFDGLDIDAAESEFAHYLPGIASRDDLSYLFREMMSYLAVGHMFIRGGYVPKMSEIKDGLLGADYRIEHGHYRIARIYRGGAWNPGAYAPLAQPGLKVKVGDYLLAVNGNALDARDNIYAAFEDLANKTVTLTVGPNPDASGSHTIVVKTIPSEAQLRHIAWIDHNIRLVNRLSHGKLGYVYLPDTGLGGYDNFNRYYFSQIDKEGMILDERFNHGGFLSDYIIDNLERQPAALVVTRRGGMQVAPYEAEFGPKVMIINQFAGSGGDALPWYFKMNHIGTLVGKRTWGGLVGIYGYPKLMDGGSITAPRVAVEGLNGTFPVENHGVSPNVEVWQNPQQVREGHDPQLERAIAIALKQLAAHPPQHYQRPPWRNYHPVLPPLPQTPNSLGND
jgi:tricorn protease